MTNLADTLAQYPDLGRRIHMIYAMAGAIDVPGNETAYGQAEYNVFIDARAADMVLHSGAPVTLVPLDAADDVPVTVLFHNTLALRELPGASEVVSMLLDDPYYYSGSQYFWDPLTAAIALDPTLALIKPEGVTVVQTPGPDHGRTIAAVNGAAVRVAMNVDAPGFYQNYLQVVTGEPTLRFTVPDNGLEVTYGVDGWSIRDTVHPSVGPMALRVTNHSAAVVGVTVGQLAPGHSVADVDAAMRAKVTSVPTWFRVMLLVTVPPGHPATWGVELRPGLYVTIGGGPNLPFQRLGVVRVP
jgi:hypothetical protein